MARAVPRFQHSTFKKKNYDKVKQDVCEFGAEESARVSTDQDPCETHPGPC